jgi:hypothetical protein
MSRTSVITASRTGNSSTWTVTLDGNVVFVCLSPEMALQIGCLIRRASALPRADSMAAELPKALAA